MAGPDGALQLTGNGASNDGPDARDDSGFADFGASAAQQLQLVVGARRLIGADFDVGAREPGE